MGKGDYGSVWVYQRIATQNQFCISLPTFYAEQFGANSFATPVQELCLFFFGIILYIVCFLMMSYEENPL